MTSLESLSVPMVPRATGERTRTVKPPSTLAMPRSNGYRPGVPHEAQPYTSKWDKNTEDEVEVDYSKHGDSYEYKQMGGSARGRKWFAGRKGTVLKLLLVLVVFLVGLILGFVARRSTTHITGCLHTTVLGAYSPDLSTQLRKYINASQIRDRLRRYTKNAHLTGTSANNKVKNMLERELRSYRLGVRIDTYNVMLSYANWLEPNSVSIVQNGSVLYEANYTHPVLKHPEINQPYAAYSPNGTVQGDIVYANYGEESDFQGLQNHHVPVNNNIVIMKNGGGIFTGDKISNAAARGAAGLLMYTDPADVHYSDTDRHSGVYPHSWQLPGWAVKRVSALPAPAGDPLTPGQPAVPGVRRVPLKEASLPSIPVHPISFDQAEYLMTNMTGEHNAKGVGALHSKVEYVHGPGYRQPYEDAKVRITVNNQLEKRDIYNVIGVFHGAEEPDRYVIVGCHYDAWTFGSTDANSGTAIIQELAKAFGQLSQTGHGWRPRRTVIFAHWDGAEQGLLGVYEWAEDRGMDLRHNAVAYINLDAAVLGNYSLEVKASPMLHKLIYDVTKTVPSIDPWKAHDHPHLYATWLKRSPDNDDKTRPQIESIAAGENDAAPFVYLLGVPAVQIRTVYMNKQSSTPSSNYPGSNTAIDCFNLTARAHEVLATVVGEMVLRLATQARLPFTPAELVTRLAEALNDVHALWPHEEKGPMPKHFHWAQTNLSRAVSEFSMLHKALPLAHPLLVRAYNDKIMQLSRVFTRTQGLKGKSHLRSVLFAPSASSKKGNTFPGLRDALQQYKDTKRESTWTEVEKEATEVLLAIRRATLTLRGAADVRTQHS